MNSVETGMRPATFLAYHERSPKLRVVELPSGETAPAPVQIRTSGAIDQLLLRNGWIAARGEAVWAIPIPLAGTARRIDKGLAPGVLAALDPANIWMRKSTEDENAPEQWIEMNPDLETVDELTLPTTSALGAVTPDGFLATDDSGLALVAREGDEIQRWPTIWGVMESNGSSVIALDEEGELAFIDTRRATATYLPLQSGWSWQGFGASFSPDGRVVACTTSMKRDDSDLDDWEVGGPPPWEVPYEPLPSRLALIEVEDQRVSIVDGEFDNFAWTPAWIRDGSGLVFGTPFDRHTLHLVDLDDLRLQRFRMRGNAPTPMIDVTEML